MSFEERCGLGHGGDKPGGVSAGCLALPALSNWRLGNHRAGISGKVLSILLICEGSALLMKECVEGSQKPCEVNTTLLPFSFRCGDPEARLGAQGRRQGPSEGGSRRLPLASLSVQLRNCPRAHKAGPNPDLMQDAPRGAPTGPPRGACVPRKAVLCLPELERLPGSTFFPAFRNVLALPRKYTLYIYFYM